MAMRRQGGQIAGMTLTQYAAHRGMTLSGVQKARDHGRIVLHPDGSVDVAASDALIVQATDPSQQRKGHGGGEQKPVPPAAVEAVTETLREQGLPVPQVGGGMTFLQARTANEVLKAQERRMKLLKLKGDVVDRAKAESLVFGLARQERDAWISWPARVAAMMAAEFGADTHAMQVALDRHVREHLAAMSAVSLRVG